MWLVLCLFKCRQCKTWAGLTFFWNWPSVKASSVQPHEPSLLFDWLWSTGGWQIQIFPPIFLSSIIQTHTCYIHASFLLCTHMLLLVIHDCMSMFTKKLTAVLQKSKQFAQGYLDRPSIHSWELKPPWRFHNETSIDFGFSIRNAGWIPFHLAASQMAWMEKWPNQGVIVYYVGRK